MEWELTTAEGRSGRSAPQPAPPVQFRAPATVFLAGRRRDCQAAEAASDLLHGEGNRISATKAECSEAGGLLALIKRGEKGGENPRAAGADGMTQGDRSAVHVDAIPVPAQFTSTRQRLHGEGFVGFDQVIVADPGASLLHQVAHREDGGENRSFG